MRDLWRGGWYANGVDVSQYAVAAANRELVAAEANPSPKRGKARCAVLPCFQTSAAGQLPFASASFDFALSSDVLEHVKEADLTLTPFPFPTPIPNPNPNPTPSPSPNP